ncbi:hypothetical protein PR003_g25429 [Phytophthora rubi]|uniref:Integrase catalytic domain-containing protein n=1 Tax=Phytophthora rubi TaxID=129364 RepID=A0A6A4CP78_9STRA|nr:hypothetical protein PR003_g25429 [Phytophthora rubi]
MFRPYLYGRAFTIITDHAALKWLMTRPNLAGRLHRWSLVLQEYEFQVEYRPGSTYVVADALSRAPAKVRAAVGRQRGHQTTPGPADVSGTTTTGEATAAALTTSAPATDKTTDKTTGKTTDKTMNQLTDEETTDGGSARDVTTRAPGTRAPTTTAATSVRLSTNEAVPMGTAVTSRGTAATPTTARREPLVTPRTANDTVGTTIEMATASNTPSAATHDENSGAATTMATGSGVTATTGRKRTKQTATAATRRSERLRERERRQVHWATTVTNEGGATSAAPSAEPTATTETTERAKPKAKGSTNAKATNETTVKKANAPAAKNVANRALTASDGPNDLDDEQQGASVDDYTLQLADDELVIAQQRSLFVKRLLADGKYGSMVVTNKFGLVTVDTPKGWRVVLPPTVWAAVFKEMHGSVWSGHLRGPHTYERVARLYWWPGLYREVRRWVRGCPECGSRKAKPREVIPPLRSLRGGAVGDRWALDIAGTFPVADGGDRYVIAAVEYVTRYAVASCVKEHTAKTVATFLMQEVVLRFGVFRELLTDGAPELAGKVIEDLVQLLQARQINPVPYRPQMVGLVERFHRSWKDCVATFMQDDKQTDWNLWVKFAVYSYNSARYSTVALSPNELMMGRRLRAPNELLRRAEVTEAGELPAYHANLLRAMKRSHECAEHARQREQERQARYYNRRARSKRQFQAGDVVWMYNPPRGKNATKFVHQWMGPLRILEPAGYDNFVLTREDKNGKTETLIAHVSFLISSHYPEALLTQVARDIDEQLADEDRRPTQHEQTPAAVVRTAAAITSRTTRDGSAKRARTTMGDSAGRGARVATWWRDDGEGGAIVPDSTCWSTSCTPTATPDDGRQAMVNYGSTMDVHGHGGRPWLNTNDSTWTTGSWKTLGMRNPCKEAGVSAKHATADATSAADSVEVSSGVGCESSRPCGRHCRQDLLHGILEDPETSGLCEPHDGAHFGFGRPANRPDEHVLGSKHHK